MKNTPMVLAMCANYEYHGPNPYYGMAADIISLTAQRTIREFEKSENKDKQKFSITCFSALLMDAITTILYKELQIEESIEVNNIMPGNFDVIISFKIPENKEQSKS